MRTRVRKWGNSLAIRIPRPLAQEVGMTRDAPVELSLEDGRVVVAPVVLPVPSLDELLARVTPENLHSEVDTGPRQG